MGKPEDNPVFSELKRTGALRVVINLEEGEPRKMDIPKVRNRWDRLGKVLDALAWESVEGYKGDTLTCTVTAEDAELDDGDDDEGAYVDGSADVARIASVMSRANSNTMKECREMFRNVLDGTAKMFEAFGTALGSISDAYKLSTSIRAAEVVAEAADRPGGTEVADMMKLAMAVMSMQGNKPATTTVVQAPQPAKVIAATSVRKPDIKQQAVPK